MELTATTAPTQTSQTSKRVDNAISVHLNAPSNPWIAKANTVPRSGCAGARRSEALSSMCARGRSRVYGGCLNAHYARNLCVAAICTDVGGEVRQASKESGTPPSWQVPCRSTYGSGCGSAPTRGGGSDGNDKGRGRALPQTPIAAAAPADDARSGTALWGEWDGGGFTLCRCFDRGVSILQQLIGSFVECCSVVTCVLASGLYIIASKYEIS